MARIGTNLLFASCGKTARLMHAIVWSEKEELSNLVISKVRNGLDISIGAKRPYAPRVLRSNLICLFCSFVNVAEQD